MLHQRRIGHDDDLVITQLGNIKILMDSGSEGSDHCLDLFVSVNLIQTCLLNIQDLTTQRRIACVARFLVLGRTAPRNLPLRYRSHSSPDSCQNRSCKLSEEVTCCPCADFLLVRVTCLSGCLSGSLCKNRFLNGSLATAGFCSRKISSCLLTTPVYRTSCLTCFQASAWSDPQTADSRS